MYIQNYSKIEQDEQRKTGRQSFERKEEEGISIALSNVENYTLDLKFEKFGKRRKEEEEAPCDIGHTCRQQTEP